MSGPIVFDFVEINRRMNRKPELVYDPMFDEMVTRDELAIRQATRATWSNTGTANRSIGILIEPYNGPKCSFNFDRDVMFGIKEIPFGAAISG